MDYQRITSKDSEDIVNKHWPKEMDGSIKYAIALPNSSKYHAEFLDGMRLAQIELLTMHYYRMSRVTKERATKTLKQLRGMK